MTKKRSEDQLNDKRLIKRFIRDTTVDEKDHDKFLAQLPDLEKNAEVIGVALESVGEGLKDS